MDVVTGLGPCLRGAIVSRAADNRWPIQKQSGPIWPGFALAAPASSSKFARSPRPPDRLVRTEIHGSTHAAGRFPPADRPEFFPLIAARWPVRAQTALRRTHLYHGNIHPPGTRQTLPLQRQICRDHWHQIRTYDLLTQVLLLQYL